MIFDNESLWAILGTIVGIFIGSYFTYLYMTSQSIVSGKQEEKDE